MREVESVVSESETKEKKKRNNNGGLKKSQSEASHETVREATNYAEASVYSLNNPYLNQAEKREVEMWFQLPGNVMLYSFVITAIYSAFEPLSWKYIIGIPLVANVIIGLINWYFYSKKFVYVLYLTVLHSWILYLVGIGAAVYLFFKGVIILAIISLLAPFGLLSFVEPHLFFYSILSRKYQMHPKYAFFKKEYGYTFPFEENPN